MLASNRANAPLCAANECRFADVLSARSSAEILARAVLSPSGTLNRAKDGPGRLGDVEAVGFSGAASASNDT